MEKALKEQCIRQSEQKLEQAKKVLEALERQFNSNSNFASLDKSKIVELKEALSQAKERLQTNKGGSKKRGENEEDEEKRRIGTEEGLRRVQKALQEVCGEEKASIQQLPLVAERLGNLKLSQSEAETLVKQARPLQQGFISAEELHAWLAI